MNPWRKLQIIFLCSFFSCITYLTVLLDEEVQRRPSNRYCSFDVDLKLLNSAAESFGCFLYIIDKRILSSNVDVCPEGDVFLSIEYDCLKKVSLEKALNLFSLANFNVETFYSKALRLHLTGIGENLPVAVVLRKSLRNYILRLIYSREDNTWWMGSLFDDDHCFEKVAKLSLSFNCSLPTYESVLKRFHFSQKHIFKRFLYYILLPNNKWKFLDDLQHSSFIECNLTRALAFVKKYGESKGSLDVRFKHKARRILKKTKKVLDQLGVPFWLSSGTCLGYFRECDIIAHSQDVDIGIHIIHFNENIIPNMVNNGMQLKHRFGYPNDSLELSFVDKSGIKLDMFFFYTEKNYVWNGGTQLKTGKKFKYIFPKFDLCWTLFSEMKVRVPCQTEEYIIANYGPDWFIPKKIWDWKKSPNNVYSNGIWADHVSHD